MPVSSCTDWQAAFGFSSSLTTELHDDDLGKHTVLLNPWNFETLMPQEVLATGPRDVTNVNVISHM